MKKEVLELYSDYLLSPFDYTTAAGLSVLPDKQTVDSGLTHGRKKSVRIDIVIEKRVVGQTG